MSARDEKFIKIFVTLIINYLKGKQKKEDKLPWRCAEWELIYCLKSN